MKSIILVLFWLGAIEKTTILVRGNEVLEWKEESEMQSVTEISVSKGKRPFSERKPGDERLTLNSSRLLTGLHSGSQIGDYKYCNAQRSA